MTDIYVHILGFRAWTEWYVLVLPKRCLYTYYCVVVVGENIQMKPWRLLTHNDIQNANEKKRLRDLRALFKPVEQAAILAGATLDGASVEYAAALWEAHKGTIDIGRSTRRGRKRHRISQMSWSHHLYLYREAQRNHE